MRSTTRRSIYFASSLVWPCNRRETRDRPCRPVSADRFGFVSATLCTPAPPHGAGTHPHQEARRLLRAIFGACELPVRRLSSHRTRGPGASGWLVNDSQGPGAAAALLADGRRRRKSFAVDKAAGRGVSRRTRISRAAKELAFRRGIRSAVQVARSRSNGNRPFPATLEIDYPDREFDRLTTVFRLFTVIPIAVILALLTRANVHRRFGELRVWVRWDCVSGDCADAAVPPEVPTMVVRLEPGPDEVRHPRPNCRPPSAACPRARQSDGIARFRKPPSERRRLGNHSRSVWGARKTQATSLGWTLFISLFNFFRMSFNCPIRIRRLATF